VARWSAFTREQQILMIANELHRATRLLGPRDVESRRNAYTRALRLTDLTVEAQPTRPFRRELLRWRDLVAALYLSDRADPTAHRAALRCLLRLTFATARQLPHLGLV
jgi:hypothetical protein